MCRRLRPDVELDTEPSQVQIVLRHLQDQLRKENSPYDVQLDVVRPGTYEALKHHLQRKGYYGYYSIVHFDLHGYIDEHGNVPKLQFLRIDNSLVGCNALNISHLISQYGISCAVVNACDSGKASKGANANLSRVFIQGGISNVLAISFRWSVDAANIFNQAFYYSFLVRRRKFSEAGSDGRLALRNDTRRRTPYKTIERMQDWFVPVTYAGPSKVDHRISTIRDKLEEGLLTSFMGTPWCLPVVLFVTRVIDIVLGYLNRLRRSSSGSPALLTPNGQRLYLHLDLEILQFERLLTRHRIIYHFGHEPQKIDKMLIHLSNVWHSTGFVDHSYIIHASRFFEEPYTLQWLLKKYIWRDFLYHFIWPSISTDTTEPWVPKTAIIITHVDVLFGEDSARKEEARKRLYRFMRLAARKSNPPLQRLMYLVVFGLQNREDWWNLNFINVDSLYGQRFIREKDPEYISLDIPELRGRVS
ncbi:MAG: hypothetical protein MMC33_004295 [Icmadophila ericetorum]|nr:hypothetical protein [Icmadophila ericetorum]